MDPLDHNHLLARGSKIYENNEKYFFKAGTYESLEAADLERPGPVPRATASRQQRDPSNDGVHYRTASDTPWTFDDEGNGTRQTPGRTRRDGRRPRDWHITMTIETPGQPWTGPITVHDNRNNALTDAPAARRQELDRRRQPHRRQRRAQPPRDGKIGTMYVCWGYDGATAPPSRSW